MPKTVLVVEDEIAIREMVVGALARAGFDTLEAEHAAEARDLLARDYSRSDSARLDASRHQRAGVSRGVLRRDDRAREVPIIMLTARTEEGERVKGFEAGVDDYVAKPFSVRELIARIHAVLGRAGPPVEDEPVHVAGLKLDPVTHRVMADGQSIKLGPTEFRLLKFFMTHLERVFSRTQLLDQVWGTTVVVEERTVDVHIRRLRKDTGTFRV